MKIKAIRFFAAIAFVLFATGCGAQPKSTPPALDIADSILDNVTFRDAIVLQAESSVENLYDITDAVAEYAVYTSGSGATAEEIAVFKLSDEKNAEAVIKMVEKRVGEQRERYEAYVPGEMVKLKDPVIVAEGDVVILVLADDRQQAEQAAKDATASNK